MGLEPTTSFSCFGCIYTLYCHDLDRFFFPSYRKPSCVGWPHLGAKSEFILYGHLRELSLSLVYIHNHLHLLYCSFVLCLFQVWRSPSARSMWRRSCGAIARRNGEWSSWTMEAPSNLPPSAASATTHTLRRCVSFFFLRSPGDQGKNLS